MPKHILRVLKDLIKFNLKKLAKHEGKTINISSSNNNALASPRDIVREVLAFSIVIDPYWISDRPPPSTFFMWVPGH